MNSDNKILDIVKNNIPLFSTLLLIISLFRLIIFYDYFGINIVSYIDITEALIISSPVFMYFGLFTIAVISIGIMSYNPLKKYNKYVEIDNNLNFLLRLKKSTSSLGYYLFIFVHPLVITFLILEIMFREKSGLSQSTYIIGIAFIIHTYDDFWKNEILIKLKYLSSSLGKGTADIIYLIFLIFTGLVLFTRHQASNVVYGDTKSLQQMVMVSDGDTIRTNEIYRYIGRTKNYLFIYNIKTGYSYSYDLRNIKFFSLKEDRPHISQ